MTDNPRKTLLFSVFLASLAGCTCAPARPMRVVVPSGAADVLIAPGIPVSQLQRDVFSTINPAVASSSIVVAQEWLQAPSMTMINLAGMAATADTMLAPFLKNSLPPLERELAICGRVETNHDEFALPTSATYEMPVVMTGADLLSVINDMNQAIWGVPLADPALASQLNTLPFIQAVRANGELTSLTITPGTSPSMLPDGTNGDTRFNLSLTASNLNLRLTYGAGQYDLHLDTLGVICPAVISAPAGACGEVTVSCVAPTVTTTGWTTDFPPLTIFPISAMAEGILKDELKRRLTAGALLHFQNRVVTSLSFVTDGDSWLKLKGEHTTSCSPVPVPLPPAPPTRGLVREQTTRGYGELVGEFGNVIPFEILPEMKVDWFRKDSTRTFLPVTQLQEVWPFQAFGSALPAPFFPGETLFDPENYQVELRLAQHVPKPCYQAPFNLQRLVELGESNSFYERTDEKGKRSLTRDLPEELWKRAAGLKEISGVSFEKDVMPLVNEWSDGSLPPFNGPSDWTRVVVMFEPDAPIDGPRIDVPLPLEVIVWLGRDFLDVEKNLKPTLACDPKSMLEKVKFERIYSLPTVVFHPFMIDSAEFASVPDPTAGTGIENMTSSPQFVRTDVPTPGGQAVKIALTSQCPIRRPGQPLQAPCWSEHVTFPEKGRFTLDKGFSGTTAQRLPIRTAVSTGNTGAYGARVAAVQGILDRSAIETYTMVPQPYVDVGLVPMVSTSNGPARPLDYRGLVYLDWEHGSSFAAPNGTGHLQTTWRSDWRFPADTEYWANWKKDDLVLKTRIATPFSFCPLPTEVFATPLQFSFFRAGLSSPVTLTAGQILTAGAVDPAGNFRVSIERPATGNFGAVLP